MEKLNKNHFEEVDLEQNAKHLYLFHFEMNKQLRISKIEL